MTDSNDDTPGRPPRARASRPHAGGDRPPRSGGRPPGKPGAARSFKDRGDDRKPGSRPARYRGDEDHPSGERPPRASRDDGPARDRPPRVPRDDDRRGWRPEGERKGDRPFHDPDAGERPRWSGERGERPSRARGDERPRGPRTGGERPTRGRDDTRYGGERPSRGRDDARARSAPRDERRREAAPKALAAEARLQAEEPAEERIAKVIARAGVASRRDAEAMIAEGRVTLNGEVLTSPAVNVKKDDRITVDGEPLPAKERTRLWLYHKERGLVTTARDPEGRPTVFDALPEDLPRVVAVGRLDINTEGLLLLTNDGGLAKVIAHPDTGWLRRYRVRAHGDVTQADLDRLRDGVTVDGMEYGPVEARLDRVQGDNVWITLGLREGKNREVKRILEHLGLSVNRLIRVSFGPFQLGDLEPGLVEEVRTRVLKDQLGETLAAQAGVDFESPVREPIAPFGTKPERDEETSGRARGERPKRGREDRAPSGRARDEERPSRGRDDRSPRGGRAEPERTKRDPLEPRRSVWRAAGEEPRPVRKAPRRGADPHEARTQSAEREHERVGAITGAEGRKILVERLVSAPVPEPAEKPRRASPRPTVKAAPSADDRPRRPRETGAARRPDRDEAPRSPRSAGDRPHGAKRPASAGSDRPARSRRTDGASEDRSYRAHKPDGARSDRPFRSRDAERGPRGGGDDRPRRGPPRGVSPGRGGEDRPRRGPPRGDVPGRGGSKGDFKGGSKGGSRGGPGGGRGGPRGRS